MIKTLENLSYHKWNFEKKNTERSFWNIINNEVTFYYQFEGGYMDEADTLGRVAQ